MAEKLLDNQICENCEAEIRQNALFCYNCGFQVVEDEIVEAENNNGSKVSNAWFKDSITEAKETENIAVTTKTSHKKTDVKVESIDISMEKTIPAFEVSDDSPINTKAKSDTTKNTQKTKTEDLSKLKTAASLRQQSRLAPKKTVEVVWDAPKSTPNVWFLIVSLVFAGLAVAALFAMLYIR